MRLLDCQEVSNEAFEVTEQLQIHQLRCSVWEFLFTMFARTLVRVMCGMRDLLPLNPFSERMMAAKQAHFDVHGSSCSSSCSWKQSVVGGGLQNFEVGTVEGLRETEVFPLLLNDPCGSSVTEGPSKRGKVSGHLVNIPEKIFQGTGGGPRARGILLSLCLLFSVLNVEASRYRGVSKHKNSKVFHCETEYFGSFPRKKIYFGKYETEKMAALACDVAFFYTGMPSAKFNFK
ncbi:hypothetical protein M758_4G073900 [Ceratodon purpureus]|nr:hypothetical protein M758_4G073900 [Ceratodon purpureus]